MTEEDCGVRLDRWLRRRVPDLTQARLERLLRTGQIRLDGRRAKAATKVAAGQEVRLPPGMQAATGVAPVARRRRASQPADIDALRAMVLYEDDWVVALNKPSGLAVQGGAGQSRHLDGMLDALRSEQGERPRLVHRLDRDTSGVLILARTVGAARRLAADFRAGLVRKIYWAAVVGVPKPRDGTVALALAKLPGAGGEKVAASEGEAGRAALTCYALAAQHGRETAWLALSPLTGRTHQIRVHCAALGHPIVGDGKYGGTRAFPEAVPAAKRLHLHARELAVPHPDDGTTLRITAPLPAHMAETWQALDFPAELGGRASVALERLIERHSGHH